MRAQWLLSKRFFLTVLRHYKRLTSHFDENKSVKVGPQVAQETCPYTKNLLLFKIWFNTRYRLLYQCLTVRTKQKLRLRCTDLYSFPTRYSQIYESNSSPFWTLLTPLPVVSSLRTGLYCDERGPFPPLYQGTRSTAVWSPERWLGVVAVREYVPRLKRWFET